MKWHKSIKSYIQHYMDCYNNQYVPLIFQWNVFEGNVDVFIIILD